MAENPDIKAMENEICQLQQEISRLHLLLEQAGISYEQLPVQEEVQDTVLPVPITEAYAKLLYSVFRGIAVYTLAAEQYPEEQQKVVAELIHMLRDQTIWVEALPTLHEHFAILDHLTSWYGSANLMSRTKEEDNMIRIVDSEVCETLLEGVKRSGDWTFMQFSTL